MHVASLAAIQCNYAYLCTSDTSNVGLLHPIAVNPVKSHGTIVLGNELGITVLLCHFVCCISRHNMYVNSYVTSMRYNENIMYVIFHGM